MKAVLYTRYGGPEVLHLGQAEKPSPRDREVLIRVRAVEATKSDCEMRSFEFQVNWFWLPLRLALGLVKPRRKVLGGYFSGVVEAAGAGGGTSAMSGGILYLGGGTPIQAACGVDDTVDAVAKAAGSDDARTMEIAQRIGLAHDEARMAYALDGCSGQGFWNGDGFWTADPPIVDVPGDLAVGDRVVAQVYEPVGLILR